MARCIKGGCRGPVTNNKVTRDHAYCMNCGTKYELLSSPGAKVIILRKKK